MLIHSQLLLRVSSACLLFIYLTISQAAVPLPEDPFWHATLINLKDITQRAMILVPNAESIPLTYQSIIINEETAEANNYFSLTSLIGYSAILFGGVGFGAVALQQAGLFLANTALFASSALTLGGSMLVLGAASSPQTSGVWEDGHLIAALRREQLSLAQVIIIQNDNKNNENWEGNRDALPPLLERFIQLDRSIQKQVQYRVTQDVFLIQYALACALIELTEMMDPVIQADGIEQLRTQATTLLTSIIQSNPKSSIALNLLAQIELERFINLSERNPYAADRAWQDASDDLERSAGAEPQNYNTTLLLIYANLLKSDYESARVQVLHILKHDDNPLDARAAALHLLGDIETQAKHPVLAFMAYWSSFERKPTVSSLRRLEGFVKNPAVSAIFVDQTGDSARLARLFIGLQILEAQERSRSFADSYYVRGSMIIAHQRYYQETLRIATDLYRNYGDRAALRGAQEHYAVFQALVANQNILDPTIVKNFQTQLKAAHLID